MLVVVLVLVFTVQEVVTQVLFSEAHLLLLNAAE
jgi:hypothetical protein